MPALNVAKQSRHINDDFVKNSPVPFPFLQALLQTPSSILLLSPRAWRAAQPTLQYCSELLFETIGISLNTGVFPDKVLKGKYNSFFESRSNRRCRLCTSAVDFERLGNGAEPR